MTGKSVVPAYGDSNEAEEKELFETAPVHKAVMVPAIPSIISQIASIICNLADTFYSGQLQNPYMVAAVTLVYLWFSLLTAPGDEDARRFPYRD